MIRKLLASVVVVAGVMGAGVASADETDVNVLYAGSLVNLMERSVGPAFEKETGLHFKGYAAGSNKIANEIKGGLRRGDVFISASPKVNTTLMGEANGNRVTWYVNFAESPLLIGYNPKSRFANDFRTKQWDQVLREPGLRIGRTDPKLDPKGAFTVELMTKAAEQYHQPDLVEKTLGAPENPAQVLPEETLVGRLQSGQLDAGFFYSTETSDLKIPSIHPAPELKIKASYTLTILNDAPNSAGAARFVNFLLSAEGRKLLADHGVDVVRPGVTGNAQSIPASVQAVIDAAQQ
ncbi:extracellular solute-binding protein [Paraburkholderia caballeronis]|uniref:Molybdate/tungstate transport system substrate-binding protein n=1 Tax=Paraburkholderia caballeronis TaxID=416943 RepID=A0A1H7VTA8_9BURK|nr:extracellular solute-binding protein [Paraburkholderia caballeronis]PXW15448.1 molybdate/tungstate transport system substrate-binding protein [Paraburkholderia caballeronis]PXW93733.1 molybdate/tungstate transport system substrate-binding protein [Paraburkholderia caballeronis]RAJ88973.1 molybdate/tungstate transport system substrate-binding protein [Paraburkholderia caballeronis]TDV24697.1 molybdate/tungstate transport system substrate-binding protein [Paraburkholderia caballeronis]SED9751